MITPISSASKLAMEAIDTGATQVNAVRYIGNVPRALERAKDVALFQKCGAGIHLFVMRNPTIAKIIMVSHIFMFLGVIAQLPQLCKEVTRIVANSDPVKRLSASMKVTTAIGKVLRCVAYTAIGFEAFHMGAKLGKLGLDKLATIFTAGAAWANMIYGVGLLLSAAQTFVDGRSFWKTRKFQQNFQKQEWYRSDGRYTVKELELFKAYIDNLSYKETKVLGKSLQVNGAVLKKHLLAAMDSNSSIEQKLKSMNQHMKLLTGKLRTSQHVHIISVFTGIVGLIGSICLFIPFLQPVALSCLAVVGVATVTKMLVRSILNYRFENAMGMIERQGQKEPVHVKDRMIDFFKWQVGWNENTSLLNRILKAGNSVLTTAGDVACAIADTVDSAATILRGAI